MKKKFLTSICVISMVLAFGACKDKKNEDEKEEEKNPVKTEQTSEKEEYVVQESKLAIHAEVGGTVVLGAYEQDGNTENGAEAIEWRVLEVKDGEALLISEYGLEAMPYNDTEEPITWEECSLRAWLNGEFYEGTFSEDEKEVIVLTKLTNDDHETKGTEGGNDTKDNVFLLSVDEARLYFGEDEQGADRAYNINRAAKPSAYAATKPMNTVKNGSWYDGNCPYWLRSPGVVNYIAAIVDYNGDIYDFGHGVNTEKDMVRPAILIEVTEE